MQKLNELETLAKQSASMRLDADVNVSYANFITQIEPEHIIDIAEHVRELEKHAEAAEAKLKEKDELIHSLQETVYRYSGPAPAEQEKYSPVIKWLHPGYPVAVMELSVSGKYFTRPAPAINLADLVLNEDDIEAGLKMHGLKTRVEGHSQLSDGFRAGASWTRSNILRNIEEANK